MTLELDHSYVLDLVSGLDANFVALVSSASYFHQWLLTFTDP